MSRDRITPLRKDSSFFRDVTIYFSLFAMILILAITTDLNELVSSILDKYEFLELDEIFFTVFLLSFLLTAFTVKRYRELKVHLLKRRIAIEMLSRDDQFFHLLLDAQNEGAGLVDLDETFIYCNQAGANIFGLEPGQMLGRNLREFISAEELEKTLEQTLRRQANKRDTYQQQIITPSGETKIIQVSASPYMDDEGTVCGSFAVFWDITEKINSDRALKNSEERFRTIVESPLAGTLILDKNMVITYSNERLAEMLGYQHGDLVGHLALEFVAPHHKDLITENFKNRLSGKKVESEYDFDVLCADGNTKSVTISVTVGKNSDNEIIVISNLIDNSEQIRYREELKKQRELLINVMDMVPHIICAKDEEGVFLLANKATAQQYGVHPSELVGKNHYRIHPNKEEADLFKINDQEVIEKEIVQIIKDDNFEDVFGNHRLMNTLKMPFEFEKDKKGILISAVDVTEQRIAEGELKRRDKILNSIAFASSTFLREPDWINRIEELFSMVGNAIEVSRISLYQFESKESDKNEFELKKRWLNNREAHLKVNPDENPEFSIIRHIVDTLKSGDIITINAENAHHDFGEFMWNNHILSTVFIPLIVKNEFWGFLTLDDSIAQRQWSGVEKEALGVLGNNIAAAIERQIDDEIIVESEERFRTLIENVMEIGVQGYNEDGHVFFWNQKSEEIYGYTKEEAMGQHLFDLIMPEEMQEYATEKIKTGLATGNMGPGEEIVLKRKDGSPVYVFSNHSVLIRPGKETMLYCFDIDLSERRKIEEALQQSLSDKELLLRELHHRVKNNLQLIISMITLQSRGLGDREYEACKELQGRVSSISLVHDQLHKSNIDTINLKKYTDQLASNLLSGLFKDKADIDFKIQGDDLLMNTDSAIHCGLIINEIIVNTIKHAFKENEQGKIIIEMKKMDDATGKIIIRDNGKGVENLSTLDNNESMGIKMIKGLVRQLRGEIDFTSKDGFDVEFTFELGIKNQ